MNLIGVVFVVLVPQIVCNQWIMYMYVEGIYYIDRDHVTHVLVKGTCVRLVGAVMNVDVGRAGYSLHVSKGKI